MGAQSAIRYFTGIHEIYGVLDDARTEPVNGIPVLGKITDTPNFSPDEFMLFITFSSHHTGGMVIRRRLYEKYSQTYEFANMLRSDILCESIGTGNFIFPGVNTDWWSTIGNNNVISAGNTFAHHTTIGSSCLFGPGNMLSCQIIVGDGCIFGSGIIIEPFVTIGSNVTIASGTVVLQDIPDNSYVLADRKLGNMAVYQGGRRVRTIAKLKKNPKLDG